MEILSNEVLSKCKSKGIEVYTLNKSKANTIAFTTNYRRRREFEITFLRDFDCLYGKYYSTEKDPERDDHLPALSRIAPLMESYRKGVEDKSIRPSKDPELLVLTIFQSFLAVAERVLPEEAACRSAYGYGREILLSYIRTTLSAIKS